MDFRVYDVYEKNPDLMPRELKRLELLNQLRALVHPAEWSSIEGWAEAHATLDDLYPAVNRAMRGLPAWPGVSAE